MFVGADESIDKALDKLARLFDRRQWVKTFRLGGGGRLCKLLSCFLVFLSFVVIVDGW